jgi:dolichol-phosphate mannosyltransferase
LSGYDYEFVFTNDGSDDGSLEELVELHQKDKKVKVISFSRNFGQVQAITASLNEAKGDIIISLSCDLQDPIEKIPEMVKAFEEGNDVVISNRVKRNDNVKQKMFASLYYLLMKTSKLNIPEGGFDLFLLSKKANNELKRVTERNRYLHADILWLGFNVKLIPGERKKRTIGKSQYSFRKRLNSLLVGYFNTSYFPLRFMSLLGIIFTTFGIIYSISITINYFINNTPFKGWAPIMILLLIIGGMIMLMLGIIGEYIWRIMDETKRKPYYIIDKKYE